MTDVVLPCWMQHMESTGAPVINLLSLPFAVFVIVIGAFGLYSCNTLIPKYLIVHGAISIAGSLVRLYVAWRKWRAHPNHFAKSPIVGTIMLILVSMGLVVLAFGMHATFSTNPHDCNPWVYGAACASFLLFFFILIFSCCHACGVGWHAWKEYAP